jgi:hypothetical protein
MSDELFHQIEKMLEAGGEPEKGHLVIDGELVDTIISDAEMRIRYGDDFMNEFWQQANDAIRNGWDRTDRNYDEADNEA